MEICIAHYFYKTYIRNIYDNDINFMNSTKLPTFHQTQYYYLLSLKECQALSEPGLSKFAQIWAKQKHTIAFPNSNPECIEGLLIHELGNDVLLMNNSIPPLVSWSFSAGVIQQYVHYRDTCIWEPKSISLNETKVITGHLHHVLAINTVEGRVIIDWGIGQFQDTNHLLLLIGGVNCMKI